MSIETRVLTRDLWPAFEALFEANGGVAGGCWCVWWRLGRGERFADLKGRRAKRRIRELIRAGQANGVLAFVGGIPVGWCAFDRRVDLAKLDRAPSLACDDAPGVWSIPCFFVDRRHRRQGVARALLRAALDELRRRGAGVVEGYPVRPGKDGARVSAVSAFTGTTGLFRSEGFHIVASRPAGRQRARKSLA